MSRAALALAAAALLLHPRAAGAEDQTLQSRAWIEQDVFQLELHQTNRHGVFVGEVVTVSIDISYDNEWFSQHATPLFRQPMDIPLRAIVPAFGDVEGLQALADPARIVSASHEPTFALGDEVVRATHTGIACGGENDELSWRIAGLSRRFVVTREGEIVLPAPSLEFAWAETFELDLLGTRTPVRPQRVTNRGEPLRLKARKVPEEGRPQAYQGLIGSYTLGASADRSVAAVVETVRLTVVIEGRGNHETLSAPRFEGLEGFHVLGTLDDQEPARRTLRIDLAPLDASVREIPVLTLAFFDPKSATYEVARSQAIPLTVKGAVPPAPPPPEPPAVNEPPQPSNWFLPSLLALVLLAGVCAWLWKRSRRPSGTPNATVSLEPALSRLRAAAHAGSPAASEALLEVLAQHLKTTPAALVDANLASELEASGLPRALSERAAAAVEAGIAARYAGPNAAAAPLPPGLVEELEQALRTTRSA